MPTFPSHANDLLSGLTPHLVERARILKDTPSPAPSPSFILYWMHHAARGHENPALNTAILIANQLGAVLTSSLGITNSKFDNLSWLIFIANIVLILPLPSLYLIDEAAYNPAESKSESSDANAANGQVKSVNGTLDTTADSSTKMELFAEYETKKLLIRNNKKECNINIHLDLEECKKD